MRNIREVLRLRKLGLSQRKIARSVRLGQSTVSDYLLRLKVAKLSWDEIESLDDVELERRLFPGQGNEETVRPHPDWPAAHQELKRKGVTLSLLWQEYKDQYPDGFGYSRYCDLYRGFRGTLDVSLRQEHIGGEKLFVDYAGQTMPIHDRSTGEIREAQIFVATLGASHLIYAEATFGQDLRSWIGSHVRCFEWLGGVPEIVVPDNLKSGVTSPCRYEPEVNRTYAEMASHYDVAVIPARVRRPQDKAKVENGVLQVTR